MGTATMPTRNNTSPTIPATNSDTETVHAVIRANILRRPIPDPTRNKPATNNEVAAGMAATATPAAPSCLRTETRGDSSKGWLTGGGFGEADVPSPGGAPAVLGAAVTLTKGTVVAATTSSIPKANAEMMSIRVTSRRSVTFRGPPWSKPIWAGTTARSCQDL